MGSKRYQYTTLHDLDYKYQTLAVGVVKCRDLTASSGSKVCGFGLTEWSGGASGVCDYGQSGVLDETEAASQTQRFLQISIQRDVIFTMSKFVDLKQRAIFLPCTWHVTL